MSDPADGLAADTGGTPTPDEDAESVTIPTQNDPAVADHPTGQAQAAENEDLELPG